MIPSTNSKLLVAEDWTKIYQSFNNSDFKSYDFETLRRTMIQYLRENYPEDFNDYIDSSEYVALVDLIAYLGQNLSFRVDLNARENFLETAQRRDSILRLAKLINYNAKRNVPASGLLKITGISTTESVYDPSGINLANTSVAWNDATNVNWYTQFLTILNTAMPTDSVFGKPYDRSVIAGIPTERYQISSALNDVPVFGFSKSINGITTEFEVVSSTFSDKTYIYEAPPLPAANFNFLFRNDTRGNASANTGFFVYFKQGTLSLNPFNVDVPVENEIVGVNVNNINDTDVWLWQLDSNGNYSTEWTKVDAVTGNNIIYNNISNSNRNIFAVTTRIQDQIDLNFADGAFGNLPKGNFILYYRQSNGLAYSISPDQVNGIQVKIPYFSKSGQKNTLSITLSLQYTVDNATGAESDANIKLKAPQTYYTQNRMVTAEDYNISPLTAGTDILKVKSINRVSSGISKYYELNDVSGKYSSVNIYGTDGVVYKDRQQQQFNFTFTGRNEIYSIIANKINPILESNDLNNFYFDEYRRVANYNNLTGGAKIKPINLFWKRLTSTTNQTTGYFTDSVGTPQSTGYFSSTSLKYAINGALIKFTPPAGKYFLPNGKLVSTRSSTTLDYFWSQLVLTIGDGSNNGAGSLVDGTGPITLTNYVASDAVISEIIPPLVTTFSPALQSEITNLCLSYRNFGLRFSRDNNSWYVINDTDLNLNSPFTLLYQGDTTNSNFDASWLFAFIWTGVNYEVRYRFTEYIFESINETAFNYDTTKKNFDFITNTVIKDKITVLGINSLATNTQYGLGGDYLWQLDGNVVEADGYIEPKKVKVSFYDGKDDGQLDDPDSFDIIVQPDSIGDLTTFNDKFVYFKSTTDGVRYDVVDSSLFRAYPTEEDVPDADKDEGQLYYFYDTTVNVVTSYSSSTPTPFTLEPLYFAKIGRRDIKFHYQHNSGDDRRLDPSKTNLIDVYMLTGSYDSKYRAWLAAGTGVEPLPPTSSSLEENYSSVLEPIKSISDQIIYQSVKYKPLFGSQSSLNLQATFKVVKNSSRAVSDNDIKARVSAGITEFFKLDNWDFGQTFYFSELSTYIMNLLTPDITNFIIVPKSNAAFGSLYEIACQSNEIFVNGATVNDIEIIDAITASQLKTTATIVTSAVGVY
jgi:hypothetical protein